MGDRGGSRRGVVGSGWADCAGNTKDTGRTSERANSRGVGFGRMTGKPEVIPAHPTEARPLQKSGGRSETFRVRETSRLSPGTLTKDKEPAGGRHYKSAEGSRSELRRRESGSPSRLRGNKLPHSKTEPAGSRRYEIRGWPLRPMARKRKVERS